ncbi:MAG: hypothetical protein ACK443_08075, partial [Methylococcaceae bacterium]
MTTVVTFSGDQTAALARAVEILAQRLAETVSAPPKFTTSRADFGLLDVKPAFAIKHLRARTGLILKTSVVSRDDAILLA